MSMVPGFGFEPKLADSESAVLPLDDPGVLIVLIKNRYKARKKPVILKRYDRHVIDEDGVIRLLGDCELDGCLGRLHIGYDISATFLTPVVITGACCADCIWAGNFLLSGARF